MDALKKVYEEEFGAKRAWPAQEYQNPFGYFGYGYGYAGGKGYGKYGAYTYGHQFRAVGARHR